MKGLGVYRGLRVLVTGHTGFKGAWLCHWLSELGAKVAGLSLPPPTRPSLFQVLGLARRIEHHQGDIRDLGTIETILARFRPQAVFHLAAQAIVRAAYEGPKETFDSNVGGTVNILEAVRRHSAVQAVVVCTSDKCYENRSLARGYREEDPLGGRDPYSASKACAEIVARAYAVSYFSNKGPSLATVRAGNVIGGGDWARHRVVPDCVRAWSIGKPALIRHPSAIRPWQHVLEPISGYLELGTALLGVDKQSALDCAGEAFNFGPRSGGVYSVEDLVGGMIKFWPSARWRHAGIRPDMPENSVLRLDSSKARRLLGWSAILTFTEAVAMTSEWYLAHRRGGRDLGALTSEQTVRYLDLAAQRRKALGTYRSE